MDRRVSPVALDAALERAFGGTDAERRVVVRQACDLADSGRAERDRGAPLTVGEVVANLADAPADARVPERWNWWLGALEVAYGGYEPFQVRAVERDARGGGGGDGWDEGGGESDGSGGGDDAPSRD